MVMVVQALVVAHTLVVVLLVILYLNLQTLSSSSALEHMDLCPQSGSHEDSAFPAYPGWPAVRCPQSCSHSDSALSAATGWPVV